MVEGLVEEHVSQLEQVTSLREGDYETAYAAIRETYAHMFAIGDGLTVGALTRLGPEVEGRDTAFSPAVDMRLTLDRLLGEHTYLAAIVMRADLEGGAHLQASVDALSANSAELADQIDAIYGTAAASAFSDLWTRHTSDYLDYVQATADGDDGRKQAALDGLAASRSQRPSWPMRIRTSMRPHWRRCLPRTRTTSSGRWMPLPDATMARRSRCFARDTSRPRSSLPAWQGRSLTSFLRCFPTRQGSSGRIETCHERGYFLWASCSCRRLPSWRSSAHAMVDGDRA